MSNGTLEAFDHCDYFDTRTFNSQHFSISNPRLQSITKNKKLLYLSKGKGKGAGFKS